MSALDFRSSGIKVKPPMKRNISKKLPESVMRKARTILGDVSELAEKTPAHWLLAWYACGGYTKPASLLEEAVEAMAHAATCLDDFESARGGEGFVVEKALDSAGKCGKVWRVRVSRASKRIAPLFVLTVWYSVLCVCRGSAKWRRRWLS